MINSTIYLGILILLSYLSIGCSPLTKKSSSALDGQVNLAMVYLQQGNYEKARGALNQAIAYQPREPLAWTVLGYLEESTGNLQSASTAYLRAIALAPKSGEMHNNYGVFLCRHGQSKVGMQEILQAIQFPEYIYRAKAYWNLALCAQSIHDFKAAEAYFKIAKQNESSA